MLLGYIWLHWAGLDKVSQLVKQKTTIWSFIVWLNSSSKSPLYLQQLQKEQKILVQALQMPRSFKWLLSFRFPHKTLHVFLVSPIHGICPNHFTLHNLITTIFGKK